MATVFDVVVGRDSTINKHGGQDTSNAAWTKARVIAKEMREKIYRIIQYNEERFGFDEGVTLKELADGLGKLPHTISGRLSDLHDLGRIKKTGFIRDGCRAWTTRL